MSPPFRLQRIALPTFRTFVVRPSLPTALKPLDAIARNLWWCWHPPAVDLFHRIDRDLWHELNHNPLALLGRVSQAQLEALALDEGFLAQLAEVQRALQAYLEAPGWFLRHAAQGTPRPGHATPAESWPHQRIAYFSAEFGLSEGVPIYSGGLGVLAGDHLKSASDLGIPLVAVGLLYREVFHQYLNADGWQQEVHPETDVSLLPVSLQRRPDGQPLTVEVDLPGRRLHARVWRLEVGRVPLLLLDTNLKENAPEDQKITDRLYGGDLDMRLRQEILLGIGGLRALHALDLAPAVCHMNEGHAGFLALERTRRIMAERKLSFDVAREISAAGNAFTTHTPVPAGNDRFPPELMDRYFGAYREELGLSRDEFLALGREEPRDGLEYFCMTVLALKLAAKANGVARLHGAVSRSMWKRVYPGVPVNEVPIGSVTNGVHQRSFLSPDMRRLFDSYLGPKWVTDPDDPAVWQRVERIPAEELWRAHERCRERMIAFARDRLQKQVARRGGGQREVAEAREALDPKALTLGFARRFASYKRATLLLRDPERLHKILNNPHRPVQLVFSGKAHQKDEPGKEIIRKVVHLAGMPEFRHKIVFIEDYDMNVARYLVQGVDVWLNNPVRPLEASGTSGMKSVVNGGIHMSVLDGWWAEAYEPAVGWAIGNGEEYSDREAAEKIEADAMYHLLESEVVPLFYDRSKDGLPRGWIEKMRASISRLGPVYNTHRMVREYFETAYGPLIQRLGVLTAKHDQRAKDVAAYRRRVTHEWPRVAVRGVEASADEVTVGQPLRVRADVALGALRPDEVDVQLVHGPVDARGEIGEGQVVSMTADGARADSHGFVASVSSAHSGRFGYGVRVVPRNEDLATPFGVVPVRWA
jgi:starch phosphorylase